MESITDPLHHCMVFYLPLKDLLSFCLTSREHSKVMSDQKIWKHLLWRTYKKKFDGPDAKEAYRLKHWTEKVKKSQDPWDWIELCRYGLDLNDIKDLSGNPLPKDVDGNMFFKRFIFLCRNMEVKTDYDLFGLLLYVEGEMKVDNDNRNIEDKHAVASVMVMLGREKLEDILQNEAGKRRWMRKIQVKWLPHFDLFYLVNIVRYKIIITDEIFATFENMDDPILRNF